MRRAFLLLALAVALVPVAPAAAAPSHACIVARAHVKWDLQARTTLRRQLRHATGAYRASIVRRLGVVRHDLKRDRRRRARACG